MLPAIIRAEFEYVNPATTQENDYYGAYNILLFHAFPVSDGFVIHPQVQVRHYVMYPLRANRVSQVVPAFSRRDALDFVVYFRVELHRIPVFFVEVKTAVTIMHTSARAGADDQIRDRLRQLFDQSLSELRGISALGTRLCFYTLDKSLESITPIAIPRNEAYVNDTAPADRWDVDILTDDGYNRFMEVCNEVKALATAEAL